MSFTWSPDLRQSTEFIFDPHGPGGKSGYWVSSMAGELFYPVGELDFGQEYV